MARGPVLVPDPFPAPRTYIACGWILKNKHMSFPQWKVFFKKRKKVKHSPVVSLGQRELRKIN
jgi:hypothetical protein